MKRSGPLRRTTGLRRKTKIRQRNVKRIAKRRKVQFAEQAELCRHLPCCATFPFLYGDDLKALDFLTEWRQSDPHHCKTTGAGGTDRWTVPLSRNVHMRLDSPGNSQASVEREHGVDFEQVAIRLHRHLMERPNR